MKTKDEIQKDVVSSTKKFLENNNKLRNLNFKLNLFITLLSVGLVAILILCKFIFFNDIEYVNILGLKIKAEFHIVIMGVFVGSILLFIKDFIRKPMSSIIIEFPDEIIVATPKNERKGIDVIRKIFEIIDQTGITEYKIDVKNDEICE